MYKRKINNNEEGQKIFKYLLRTSNATKIFLYKLFRKNKVYVNNITVTKDYIIKKDDVILCNEISEKENIMTEHMSLDIIYKDKNLIVIDKNPEETVYGEKDSIISRLRGCLKKENFLVPVHRLDKNTSGVLIFAFTYRAARIITEIFRKQKVKKTYETLLEGKIYEPIFIEAKIKREKDKSFSIVEEIKTYNTVPDKSQWIKGNLGKSATIIRPLSVVKNYTHCEVEIWTGQHHQIRTVCGKIGHPVINDIKYAAKKVKGLKYYILNCKKIEIPLLNLKFESKKKIDIKELAEKL